MKKLVRILLLIVVIFSLFGDPSGVAAGRQVPAQARMIGFYISPGLINFGYVKVNTRMTAKLTISNPGDENLVIGTIYVSTGAAARYRLSGDTCSGVTLVANATCTFSVNYTPTTSSDDWSRINIPSNAPTSVNQVGLIAHGMLSRLKNNGFNTYAKTTDTVPTSWLAQNFASTDGKDLVTKKEGTASIKMGNIAAKTKSISQEIPLPLGGVGDMFLLSYWVKGSGQPTTGLCQAVVIFYNETTQAGSVKLPCGSTGSYAFKQVQLFFHAPGPHTRAVVKMMYTKPQGAVWFDQVSLFR
jgi:hypothetical protein